MIRGNPKPAKHALINFLCDSCIPASPYLNAVCHIKDPNKIHHAAT